MAATSSSAKATSAKACKSAPPVHLANRPDLLTSLTRLFNYTGTFSTTGNAYLGLYGWTTDPLVEYYVIENFGDKHNPTDNSNHTCYGTFNTDGGTYEVWMKWRVNAPSIIGTATFPQFWVRLALPLPISSC